MRPTDLCIRGLLLGLLCSQSGCMGDTGPERAVVTGQVTINGAPLAAGVVKLYPTANSPAPMSAADIVDGRFVVDNLGGAAIGDYRVEIYAYKMETSKVGKETYENRIQYVPSEYNKKSILELKVTSEPDQVHNFDLTVDPKLLPRPGDLGRSSDPAF